MPGLDIEQVGRAAISVHEASHAYALFHYDIEIDHIKLEFGWLGDLTGGYVQPAHQEKWTPELFEGYVVTYAAGEIGMLRYLLEVGIAPGPAERMAEFSGSYDRPDMHDLFRFAETDSSLPELTESWARGRAHTLVDKYWEPINEVARMLSERRKLSGRVVR